MRIGINASWMTPGAAGGLEWYCRNLIEQLAAIDNVNEYVLVTGPNNHATFAAPRANWKMVVYAGAENAPGSYFVSPTGSSNGTGAHAPWPVRLYRRFRPASSAPYWTGRLRDLIKSEALDLWFCPFIYALPLDAGVPVVTCIPDLQHERCPDFFSDAQRAERAMGYQHSCESAAAVLAISQYTADEIVALYGVDARRVFAIPLGLDSSFDAFDRDFDRLVSQARLKYRLDGNYVYYPAAAWAHKNHETLLRGFAVARDKGFTGKLIFTGWTFDLLTRIKPLITELKLGDRVSHLGYVERPDVVGLLGGARALIFPSLFEGFGLPVVEAMHVGVPVACANLCSLPEVGGDAVYFFDPHSPQSIGDAIVRITGDERERARLVAAGKAQASKFNYRRTAQETLDVFTRVGNGQLAAPALPPFRPVIAHNWLLDGHSRWYFHCDDLERIDIQLDQPTSLPQLAGQRVQILLDQKLVVEADVPMSQPQRFTVPSNGPVRGGFHRLDVVASSHAEVKGETLSLRVTDLIVHDRSGRTTKLVP